MKPLLIILVCLLLLLGFSTLYYYRQAHYLKPITYQIFAKAPPNKLDAYTCQPTTDAVKGPMLICTSPDYHTEYDCSSNRQQPPFLQYFC